MHIQKIQGTGFPSVSGQHSGTFVAAISVALRGGGNVFSVPSTKELLDGTVPSNKELVDGTVPLLNPYSFWNGLYI